MTIHTNCNWNWLLPIIKGTTNQPQTELHRSTYCQYRNSEESNRHISECNIPLLLLQMKLAQIEIEKFGKNESSLSNNQIKEGNSCPLSNQVLLELATMQVVTCKHLSSLENKSLVAFYNIADEKAQKATEIYKSRNYYGNRIRRTLFGYHQLNKRYTV